VRLKKVEKEGGKRCGGMVEMVEARDKNIIEKRIKYKKE